MLFALVAGVLVAVIAAALTSRAARAEATRVATRAIADAKAEVASARRAAELEATATKRALETAARNEALQERIAGDEALASDEAAVQRREDLVAQRADDLHAQDEQLESREAELATETKEVQSRRDRASGVERDAQKKKDAIKGELEQRAGVRGAELIAQLGASWIEDARGKAAAALRAIDQTVADPAHDREAKRIMEIAGSRYRHHYLTERAPSNLRIGPELVGMLLENDGAMHKALEQVSGLQLLVNDDKDAVRLDGLDGVGKEMVRRAIGRLIKKPESIPDAKSDPQAWAKKSREHLDQEIRSLGKKAFQALGISKAHPEIVELVGALNFRTSYTQNQWWHAVEAAYLAGMMAAELGLDEKLARRATLMHDIGKALTHKIEGSHAVIGADIARRNGESEVVANAIGAHHTDEPFNSPYAYLVAASDAMSGARPGARRELAEGFSMKIDDLERIGMQRRGVAHAHAVQGGRELRVYVRERDVDDLTVVEMSTEIAAQISDEMTFPGQIKVTVIRAFEATATAN